MKKLINLSFAALAGILAFAACTKETKEEIPAVITADLDNLAKVGIEKGTPNQIKLTASNADGTLDITVYSEQEFLADASYSVGTAAGNVAIHYKDKYVDNDAVSGSVTVSSDENFNYTISGTVMLNNAEGTALKLNATGNVEFELTPLYYYTKSSKDGATVYDIYSIGETNEHLAKATVFGETGTFKVDGSKAAGSALYGNAASTGCFAKSGAKLEDGFFMQLSGSVQISKKAGQLSFVFKGSREATYTNCQEVSKVNAPAVVVPDLASASSALAAYFVPSQIVEGAYELTVKCFFVGVEVQCVTLLAGFGELALGENYHPIITDYDTYLSAEKPADGVATVGIGPACYYLLDGEPLAVPQDGTRYAQIWWKKDSSDGLHQAISSILNSEMKLMTEVYNFLVAKNQPYALMGEAYAPYAFYTYITF